MPARLTPRTALAAAFIAIFLALQVAVPAIALFGPRPARFGWQMYSALPPVPKAWTVAADGSEKPVDLATLFAAQRAEIDYESVLREGLCDATGANAIRIQATEDAPIEEIACR
jgi:hypothetical protein